MMVCADSSSVDTRNEGSSFARRCSARPIFSWSACVFGSTATEMTGIGMFIFSSVMTFSRSRQRVAGVDVLEADGRGDVAGAHFLDLAALVGVHLQQAPDAFLLRPCVGTNTVSPEFSVPE